MSHRRAAVALGVAALFTATFLGAAIDPSAAATSDETDSGVVIPPGGGMVPPEEVQDLVNPPPQPEPTGSAIHPTFALLDNDATNVLSSGRPVSTLTTCGQCHDSTFIVEHNYHATVGLDSLIAPGAAASGRAWDISNGWFGRWNPIVYRYLTPDGDGALDLSTAEWIMTLGARHAGSGPATTSREGSSLTGLAPNLADPETSLLTNDGDSVVAWDWQNSGVEELNCFLCHVPVSDNEARIAELQAGRFEWANTATLAGTSVVDQTADGWKWNPGAFNESGRVDNEHLPIGKSTNDNCGQCHGTVHMSADPIDGSTLLDGWETYTTGQVFSDQRLSASGLNFPDKDDLSRAWDIHAERGLDCISCHSSINNSAQVAEDAASKPTHLLYDPRRPNLDEYLNQPIHELAKGDTAQGTVAPEYDGTMRTCSGCHDPTESHEWLPYQERHMQVVACETCHIPTASAPAAEQYDWTVIHPDGTPRTQIRGADGQIENTATMIDGFDPVILLRSDRTGDISLSPYNLVGSWYWAHGDGDAERPVRAVDLEAAYLDGAGGYDASIVAAFDADGDGTVSESELAIDTDEKQAAVSSRLESLSLSNPHIVGEVQAYSVAHGVVGEDWAIQDCQVCHSSNSRLSAGMRLGTYVPGGVLPEFVADTNTESTGVMTIADDGSLIYLPETTSGEIEVLGSDTAGWSDWVGLAVLLIVLVGIVVHGFFRFCARRCWNRGATVKHPETAEVYIYTKYERFWHWMQATVIGVLIVTGIVIHWPTNATAFGWMIVAHNVAAAILVINALVALVDSLATGSVKRFIPHPQGFFSQAIDQTVYYAKGIFLGEPHPHEKRVGARLNPLQQATYLVILNILLPGQVITGILIWGAQRWPSFTSRLGGLGFLLPIHNLIAWFFAAFLILHIYLTTTGATPLASIKGMVTGWEEVEVSSVVEEVKS
jgi:thiosulfate reductase cytochrome b subunit